mmetsp:Transcript_23554/g.49041  ORF Transcript_23554/g.49041 Transcript_23554/m.49041 type:complete len:362 (+) Transcript_23554:739-1824(+)
MTPSRTAPLSPSTPVESALPSTTSAPPTLTSAAPTEPPTESFPCSVSSTTRPVMSTREEERERAPSPPTSSLGTPTSLPSLTSRKTTVTSSTAPVTSFMPSGCLTSSWSASSPTATGPLCAPTSAPASPTVTAPPTRLSTKSTRGRAREGAPSRPRSSGSPSSTPRSRPEPPTCSSRTTATASPTSRTSELSAPPTSALRSSSTPPPMRLLSATLPPSLSPKWPAARMATISRSSTKSPRSSPRTLTGLSTRTSTLSRRLAAPTCATAPSVSACRASPTPSWSCVTPSSPPRPSSSTRTSSRPFTSAPSRAPRRALLRRDTTPHTPDPPSARDSFSSTFGASPPPTAGTGLDSRRRSSPPA